MEIRIKKGFTPFGTGEIHDFFSEVNHEFFLDAVKYLSVFAYDQEFQFTALYLHFEQHCGDYFENVIGGGAEGVARKKWKQYLKHLQRITSTLPAGITVKIKEKSEETNYKRELFHLYIEVDVTVSAEYSNSCYSSINEGGIAHACNLSPSMKNAAKAFKERIIASHKELLYSIVSICENKYRDGMIFDQSGYYSSYTKPGDEDYGQSLTAYKEHGMKNLCGIEQCYGLAWAVAESSALSTRCRISIEDERCYLDGKIGYRKVVRVDRYPYRREALDMHPYKKKDPEPPRLTEW